MGKNNQIKMGAICSTLAAGCFTIIGGAVALVVYKITEQILQLGKRLCVNLLCSKIKIVSKENSKSIYAIKTELEILIDKSKLIQMNDSGSNVKFSLPYGVFRVSTKDYGIIFIDYDKKGMTLYKLPKISICPPKCRYQMVELKKFAKDTYRKQCSPSKIIMSYTAPSDSWSFPIIRRPTKFLKENYTDEMRKSLTDIAKFKKSEDIYAKKGINYRRGYFLCGATGTGKTTVIEIAAKQHNMSIYSINFNTKKMTDTVLINLVSTVPPNSIITLEEIDTQIKNLRKNKNKCLSLGGIFSALDGPQRLSYGSIIIMTGNRDDFLPDDEMETLMRKGRIDKKITFVTKLDLDLDSDSSSDDESSDNDSTNNLDN